MKTSATFQRTSVFQIARKTITEAFVHKLCTAVRCNSTDYKAPLHLRRQIQSIQCKSCTCTTTAFHHTNATIIRPSAAEVSLDKMHTDRVKTSKGQTLNVDKFQESGSTTFQGCVCVRARACVRTVQESDCVCGPNHLKS